MTKDETKKLQKLLNKLGHNPGIIDGIWGPKTKGALNASLSSSIPTCEPEDYIPGIDISAYNGEIDWDLVAKSDFKWSICKQSEGTTHANKRREENLKNARSVGIKTGGYHFARPDTYTSLQMQDATDEAENFLRCYHHDPSDLYPSLDLESGLLRNNHSYNVDFINQWCYTVEQELGLQPRRIIMYTARWATVSRIIKAEPGLLNQLSEHPLWWAEYNETSEPDPVKSLSPWKTWAIHQWTGHGSVPGITGNKGRVDLNKMKPDMLEKLLISP